MRFVSFLRFCITILFYQCSSIVSAQTNTISKIAFGSCSSQNHPLPIFDVVVKHEPDLFVFLGDNIYADSWSMSTIKRKYQQLADKPTFQNLKAHVPLIATWDDHDFGQNDGGKQYPFKKQTKKIFLDFFNEPDSSDRWKHDGVYTSYMYDFNGKKLQIILNKISSIVGFDRSLINAFGSVELSASICVWPQGLTAIGGPRRYIPAPRPKTLPLSLSINTCEQ